MLPLVRNSARHLAAALKASAARCGAERRLLSTLASCTVVHGLSSVSAAAGASSGGSAAHVPFSTSSGPPPYPQHLHDEVGGGGLGLAPGLDLGDGLHPAAAAQIQRHIAASGTTDAFFVVDTSAVARRFALWRALLPRVRPYYAVKCNPDAQLVHTLARLGAGFDCASKAEIRAVLGAGSAPEDVIYANPCKQGSHVAYARAKGVHTMTFDSADEVRKVHALHPDARLVLRLYVDDSKAICRLGTKFGAMLHDVPEILRAARDVGAHVEGVSFHVGSGCYSVEAYESAVRRARAAFDMGADAGYQFSLLDVGGGFPGTDHGAMTIAECAKALGKALDQHFPAHSGVRVISEPGRFFAAASHTLAVNVIGRKLAPTNDITGAGAAGADGQPNYMYFVNDGLYGSFNCVVYDHPTLHPIVIADEAQSRAGAPLPMFPASLWGPTCDGMDCIMKEVRMPLMDIGQWILFPNMGAYTCAAGSDFNGFEQPQKIYFDSSFEGEDSHPLQQFVH